MTSMLSPSTRTFVEPALGLHVTFPLSIHNPYETRAVFDLIETSEEFLNLLSTNHNSDEDVEVALITTGIFSVVSCTLSWSGESECCLPTLFVFNSFLFIDRHFHPEIDVNFGGRVGKSEKFAIHRTF